MGLVFYGNPSIYYTSIFYLSNLKTIHFIHIVILGLFTVHYFIRALIYPFRINTSGKKMPLLISIFAFLFNLINGFIIYQMELILGHLTLNFARSHR